MRSSVAVAFALLAGLLWPPSSLAAPHDDETGVEFITADDVRRLQQPPRRILLVDVRSDVEFKESRLAGAVNVPLTEIERRVGEVPRQGLVVLY